MACAVAVANGYYIHPLIAPVGADFGVGGSLLGLVPALNQVALALGILLLLPLGDRINNRKLVITFALGQLARSEERRVGQENIRLATVSHTVSYLSHSLVI